MNKKDYFISNIWESKKRHVNQPINRILFFVFNAIACVSFVYGQQKEFIPGQIIKDPLDQSKIVYNRDNNNDGELDPIFICGPGDPEGFLFQGKRNKDGTREGTIQTEQIQKLIQHGGNCIYLMAVRSHGGDAWKDAKKRPDLYPDDLHNPWIKQNPSNGINENILDQWEEWFSLMDENNILIYFFFYDDAINLDRKFGWELDSEGNLDPNEKKFIEALVNRYEHHKNLIWCISEEGQELGGQWQKHVSKIAEAIHRADDYNHIIASHQLGGNVFFLANDLYISQFAMQTEHKEVISSNDLHEYVLTAIKNACGRYSLNMAEDYIHGNISVPNEDREDIRKRNWATAMTGAHVMVYNMTIENTPEIWLNDCRILQEFFESTTFNRMKPEDDLSRAGTEYVLANKGYDYILYASKSADSIGIKEIQTGIYDLTWLDCKTGLTETSKNISLKGGELILKTPYILKNEIALYIHRNDKRPDRKIKTVHTERIRKKTTNRAPLVNEIFSLTVTKNGEKYIQLLYDDPDGGPGPYTIEIVEKPKHGTLTGEGNDKYYKPFNDFTGEDGFLWRIHDGEDSSETSIVKFFVK